MAGLRSQVGADPTGNCADNATSAPARASVCQKGRDGVSNGPRKLLCSYGRAGTSAFAQS
jgi:hypothetical protein